MSATWHFHADVFAPWGASPATEQALSSAVRLQDGTEVTVAVHLARLLVEPYRALDVPFGVAALGWCKDAAHLETGLMPLLQAATAVRSASGNPLKGAAVGDELPEPSTGAYGAAYAYPVADMPHLDPKDLAPWNFEIFGPIIDEFIRRVIRHSVAVDPLVILLGGIAPTPQLAQEKVTEARGSLAAAVVKLQGTGTATSTS